MAAPWMRRAARVLCHFHTRAALSDLQPSAFIRYFVAPTVPCATIYEKHTFATLTGRSLTFRIGHMSAGFWEVWKQMVTPLCISVVSLCW